MDSEGRTYHVGCRAGEIANRIITVGDPARLHRFAKFLDSETETKPFEHVSARGFTVVTGKYLGTPVSLIAIGMGIPMMDFMVREVRAIVEGPLVIVRLGSCGSLDSSLPVGAIGVPEFALSITTNYDFWHHDQENGNRAPYNFSKPITTDPTLRKLLTESLKDSVASHDFQICPTELHASADCFYSSQGRLDSAFNDKNQNLIKDLLAAHPKVKSLEMESAHLLHVAHIAKDANIHAAVCHMIFAGRVDGDFISAETTENLEPLAGKACLDAIIGFDIPEESLHPATKSVWAL